MRTTFLRPLAAALVALVTGALLLLAGTPSRAQTATGAGGGSAAASPKTLRYAFLIAETTFDPARVSDLYSRTVLAGIFDAPFEWEFLAEPTRMRPATAAALPEISADFKTFTIRLKPGTFFADDPAFKGTKRELVAEDYVYAIKRHYDPRWNSPNLYLLENAKILGLSELRRKAIDGKVPFEYDTPVEGLRALDRYTLQIRLGVPTPRFMHNFTDGSFLGAVAREVVEAYGDKVGEHPVGTGPYRLAEWKRSSRIVLERNPNYREVTYDETPAAGSDAALVRLAAQWKGRRLPFLDRIVISIIEEPQPRWLAFLNEEHDLLDNLPFEFAGTAIPNNRIAPNLAKKGITMTRTLRPDVSMSFFNMEHPLVGGYEPHKVALRRAISLAVDVEREIRLVRRGQAIVAQGPMAPATYGYDPAFKSTLSEFSRARAKALLDMHGYVDRNGDGWREQPDGQPLVLRYATQPDQQSRQLIEQWQKNMTAIGLRIEFDAQKWPENLKASRAGKLMMWGVGWLAGAPDADTFLALGYGPNKGGANHARFNLPAFNALYEKQRQLPDGPERLAVMRDAARLMVAYMPYKVHAHRFVTDLMHPWVLGYHRNNFVREFWKYVDIDTAELQRRGGGAPD
ncbi:MAG: ABC transporter substrate-binding protein [Rubrivivax sp.]